MKLKLLGQSFALLAILGVPLATVISCASKKGEVGIYLAIDGSTHSENDKSFNQQAYEGIQDYLDGLTDAQREAAHGQTKAYAKRPAGDKEIDFLQLYAQIPKGSTIVANGFNHSGALARGKEEVAEKQIIYLDGSLDFNQDGVDDQGFDYIAAIDYKIQEAAYLGGYALAQYGASEAGYQALRAQNQVAGVDNTNEIAVGVYGGSNIPPVTAFLGGFEFGFEDAKFDIKHLSDQSAFPHVDALKFIHLTLKSDHFSEDYSSGKGVVPTEKLRNAGADVIMAVAGPQTQDTLDNFSGKVIGPDTDQAVLYADDADRFLFSVMKDLRLSTYNMLKKINGDTTISSDYKGLGKTTIGNLANDLVKISDTTPEITSYYNAAKGKEDLLSRAQAIKNMWFWDDYAKYGHDWFNHLADLPDE